MRPSWFVFKQIYTQISNTTVEQQCAHSVNLKTTGHVKAKRKRFASTNPDVPYYDICVTVLYRQERAMSKS